MRAKGPGDNAVGETRPRPLREAWGAHVSPVERKRRAARAEKFVSMETIGFEGEIILEKSRYELKIICDFAAAHYLRNFRGKCENLHGHNWKVEVVLRGDKLDECGILVDFGEVKAIARETLDELDHTYLNEIPFFKEQNPSSENIARYLFESLGKRINDGNRRVYSVSAWESANACATYFGERGE